MVNTSKDTIFTGTMSEGLKVLSLKIATCPRLISKLRIDDTHLEGHGNFRCYHLTAMPGIFELRWTDY